jgi:hypothetical protein
MDKLYVEPVDLNSNGSNRFFIGKTCVMTSIFGPQTTSFIKSTIGIFLTIRLPFGSHFEIKSKSIISKSYFNRAMKELWNIKLNYFCKI